VCGGVGCLEAIASGPSLAGWARENGFVGGDGSAAAVADAAARGDRVALAAFRRSGEALGMAIASAVTLLDLDLVVIGGGVAAAGPLLFEPLAAAYTRYAALAFAAAPRVVPALLGAEAGLIGAAAVVLVPDAYWPTESDR
jgi:glucokinase